MSRPIMKWTRMIGATDTHGPALKGYIGFQGKHAGTPIYFRNIRIKELKAVK